MPQGGVPSGQLLARARAYRLISRLLLGPITEALARSLERVPVLAEARGTLSLDELAAAHYELFGLEVFPHAGVFLETDALASGGTTQAAYAAYAAWRYVPADEAAADHLGVQLGFLAHLTELERTARHHADAGTARRLVDAQQAFLDEQVLPYAVPLLGAVRAASVPVFSDLVELALALAATHRNAIETPAQAPVLPAWSSPVDDPSAALRDIATFLSAPARSGVWLSRADVARVGREHELPRGFGGRVQTLTNLLRNAGEYDRAGAVLSRLEHELADRSEAYDRVGAELELEPYAAPWVSRLDECRAALTQMAGALADAGAQ